MHVVMDDDEINNDKFQGGKSAENDFQDCQIELDLGIPLLKRKKGVYQNSLCK